MSMQTARTLKIIDEYKSGKSITKLAVIFGITKQRVSQILKKYKIKTRWPLPRKIRKCKRCGQNFYFSDSRSSVFCQKCKKWYQALWSKKYPQIKKCRACGRNDIRHHSNGYCLECCWTNDKIRKYRHEKYEEKKTKKIRNPERKNNKYE